MKKIISSLALTIILTAALAAQDATIYLWRNIKGMEKQPSVMFMHKPVEGSPNTRTAVIVCPGGSYHHLVLKSEVNKQENLFHVTLVGTFTGHEFQNITKDLLEMPEVHSLYQ